MNNNEKIIYEAKKGRNKIVEREDCYILRAQKGDSFFDKDPYALAAVILALEQFGSFRSDGNGGYRIKAADGKITRLSRIIYHAYQGVISANISDLPYISLQHKDGNQFNLRKDNLSPYFRNINGGPLHTITPISSVFGRYAILHYRAKNGAVYYAVINNDPGLVALLKNIYMHYYDRNKCFRAKINEKRYSLHHIIWVYYNFPNVTLDSLPDKLAELRKELKANKLSIDHKRASDIRWDNRIENLQMVSLSLNSRKHNCTSTLFDTNCFYIPVSGGEIYGRYLWDERCIELCEHKGDSTTTSIDQLRRFCKTGKFEETDDFVRFPMKQSLRVHVLEGVEQQLYSEVLIYEH